MVNKKINDLKIKLVKQVKTNLIPTIFKTLEDYEIPFIQVSFKHNIFLKPQFNIQYDTSLYIQFKPKNTISISYSLIRIPGPKPDMELNWIKADLKDLDFNPDYIAQFVTRIKDELQTATKSQDNELENLIQLDKYLNPPKSKQVISQ